jgi:hypothetical protein
MHWEYTQAHKPHPNMPGTAETADEKWRYGITVGKEVG